MTTRNLTDDLISIARASLPGEMAKRLEIVLDDPEIPRQEVGERARLVIGLLRLQAKSLEQWPSHSLADSHAAGKRMLANELRTDADQFEHALIEEGILSTEEERPQTLRGLWRGADISDDDIEEAKRSWGKAIDDFGN